MITPDDIKSARFRVAPQGYNMPDVDRFLDGLVQKATAYGPAPMTAPAPTLDMGREHELNNEIQRLSGLLDQCRRENERLQQMLSAKEAVAPTNPAMDERMSTLERAFERMAGIPGSSTTAQGSPGHESGHEDQDMSTPSAIESSLESSLFDGGYHDD